MTKINVEDINIKDIKELFSQHELKVTDIHIDKDDNFIDVYIEVSAIGIYTIDRIEGIIKKIKTIQGDLVKAGLIDDISLRDLYKGIWRIAINFKTE